MRAEVQFRLITCSGRGCAGRAGAGDTLALNATTADRPSGAAGCRPGGGRYDNARESDGSGR